MSRLSIPAGQSLREVANRLGISVDELQRHAGVDDVEAPQRAERRFEVPDGFLRARDRDRRAQMAAVPETHVRTGGMNSFLALDIEHKRTRAAGGLKQGDAPQEELDALAEARRAYLRFEADSNDLAIDLYAAVSRSRNIAVRAAAGAGQGIALAQRHLSYGEATGRCRDAALSAAKTALMADPKLPAAHLAMALALRTGATAADAAQIKSELSRAVELGQEDPWCWAELAAWVAAAGDLATAAEAVEIAMELDPACVRAREVAATIAAASGRYEKAEELLAEVARICPTCANARVQLASVLRAAGRPSEADDAFAAGCALATRDLHREHLQKMYDNVGA